MGSCACSSNAQDKKKPPKVIGQVPALKKVDAKPPAKKDEDKKERPAAVAEVPPKKRPAGAEEPQAAKQAEAHKADKKEKKTKD